MRDHWWPFDSRMNDQTYQGYLEKRIFVFGLRESGQRRRVRASNIGGTGRSVVYCPPYRALVDQKVQIRRKGKL